MIRRFGCAVLALVASACATHTPTPTPAPPAAGGPDTVAGLADAIHSAAQRSDHESDSKVRGELAAEASRNAEACLALEPQAAACYYGRAVALGLEVRAHPTRAGELLNNMLDALAKAEARDPNYDKAGPARVRALVLARAPGWPLGPGDAEAGLTAARRAVDLQPGYPPNLLALAETLAKTGDGDDARQNYARVRDAAMALPPSADRDDWLHQAALGLQSK